jgi:hypothetical protein
MGQYPPSRHDGKEWLATDCWRDLLQGTALGFIGVCLFVKGDWMELSVTLGMPTWRDDIAPCLCCKCPREADLYNFRKFLPDEPGWPDATPKDYEEACDKCETHFEIRNCDEWRAFRNQLVYDKRTIGVRGLVLKTDIPERNLHQHDRVEPTWDMKDTGVILQRPESYPVKVTTWRRAQETRTRHRNPLFDCEGRLRIGITSCGLALDVLHTIHLGVAQSIVLKILWTLFDADIFKTNILGKDERLLVHAQNLEGELFKWYGKRKTLYPK